MVLQPRLKLRSRILSGTIACSNFRRTLCFFKIYFRSRIFVSPGALLPQDDTHCGRVSAQASSTKTEIRA